jgi:glutathione S-transferase
VARFVEHGKNNISLVKLAKLAEDPDEAVKKAGQAKLRHRQRFNFFQFMSAQDVSQLDVKMQELLTKMEADLTSDGRDFLAGETYTLADIVGTAYCARIHFITGVGMFGPRTQVWWQRMKQRPSFRTAYVVSEWEDALMSKQCAVFASGGDTSTIKWTRPYMGDMS